MTGKIDAKRWTNESVELTLLLPHDDLERVRARLYRGFDTEWTMVLLDRDEVRGSTPAEACAEVCKRLRELADAIEDAAPEIGPALDGIDGGS